MSGMAKQWVAIAVTLAWAGGVAGAQETPSIEPRADRVLRIMSDVLAGAEQFTVHNDQTSDELTDSGDLVELSSSAADREFESA